MTRRHRLRGRRAFAAVRARRAAAATALLRVAVAPNLTGRARAGLAVPRAVGGAVVRNRVRRRLREVLRPHLDGLPSLDVVVSARPGAAALPFAELRRQVEACLRGARQRLGAASGDGIGDNGAPGRDRDAPPRRLASP